MRRRIGIVGAGIAGLHLALYLQKHGVDATLITGCDYCDDLPLVFFSSRYHLGPGKPADR